MRLAALFECCEMFRVTKKTSHLAGGGGHARRMQLPVVFVKPPQALESACQTRAMQHCTGHNDADESISSCWPPAARLRLRPRPLYATHLENDTRRVAASDRAREPERDMGCCCGPAIFCSAPSRREHKRIPLKPLPGGGTLIQSP